MIELFAIRLMNRRLACANEGDCLTVHEKGHALVTQIVRMEVAG